MRDKNQSSTKDEEGTSNNSMIEERAIQERYQFQRFCRSREDAYGLDKSS